MKIVINEFGNCFPNIDLSHKKTFGESVSTAEVYDSVAKDIVSSVVA
jgi:hypothetical protein